jgi:alanine racemase
VLVKSDGYGHGMEPVARVALEEGSRFVVVASLDEAAQLQHWDFPANILISGPLFREEAHDAVAGGFSVCIGNSDTARALDTAAQAQGKKARVHLKLDTGMGRFGFLDSPESMASMLDDLVALPGLAIEGVLTHFSEADDPDSAFTQAQAARFRAALRMIEERGLRPRWIHAGNSGALVYFPDTCFSMVRIGISAYGVYPGGRQTPGLDLEPVMTLACRVADVREVPAGTPVSYGRTFVTKRSSRLAVLPLGYGHGYPRHASGRAEVMIHGRRAPVVGRITMHLTIADVTDLDNVQTGDPVLVFGRLGDDVLRVEELARAADTIAYEILCNVGRCAPRIVEE